MNYKKLVEKVNEFGVENTDNKDLISILTGVKEDTAKYIAENLLDIQVYDLDITELQRTKIESMYEISKRINIAKFPKKLIINSTTETGEFCKKLFLGKHIEEMHLILLDNSHNIIKIKKISEGTVNEARVYTREVIKLILINDAVDVILTHNHPSGTLHISRADRILTKNLNEAFKVINVTLLDHIIVCKDNYISFAEQGIL